MFLSKSIPPFRCQGNGTDFHIAVRIVRPETVSVICVRSGAPSIITAKLVGTPRCGVCVCVSVGASGSSSRSQITAFLSCLLHKHSLQHSFLLQPQPLNSDKKHKHCQVKERCTKTYIANRCKGCREIYKLNTQLWDLMLLNYNWARII